mmetsp:Transcript_33269/g.43864  ORF Transcript_33269/g.43864 Transcript_33269/m.43864 type:complete len:332 (+) Transcript_33269:79-1074(+)
MGSFLRNCSPINAKPNATRLIIVVLFGFSVHLITISSTVQHLYCCCLGPHSKFHGKIAPGKSLLMIGDSLMRKQYLHICDETLSELKICTSKAVQNCNKQQFSTKIFFFQDFDTFALPSSFSAHRILASVHKVSFHVELAAIYHNFGALHTLPLFPPRPWVTSSSQSVIENPADFFGWLFLEDFMFNHYAYFTNVSHYIPPQNISFQAPKFIIMTTHWICDSKFVGEYKNILENSVSSKGCLRWLNSSEGILKEPRIEAAGVQIICSEAVLSGNGSYYLAKRMNEWAARHSLPIVDGFEMTYDQCSKTRDGRHYDVTIVSKEVNQMLELMN